jgi:hypothetical protein
MTTRELLRNAGIAGLGLLGLAQDASDRPGVGDDAALVEDGGRVARIGVADLDSGRAWVVVPLLASGDSLREADPRIVAPALRYVDVPSRVDVLRRADATWSLVQDVHRGGSLMLELVDLRANPLDATVTPGGAATGSGRSFTEVEVVSDSGSEVHRDLFAPRLAELRGRLHVIASSLPIGASGDSLTWCAPVPEEGGKLRAGRVGNGADARVARFGGEHVCVLRALTPSETLDDAAPLHVYWSGDLSTWRPSMPVDEETPLLDYDLLAEAGFLWLVGVAPGPPPAVRAWRLADRDGPWREQPIAVKLEDARVPVRLLPSTVGVPRPKLVLPGAGATAQLVPLGSE